MSNKVPITEFSFSVNDFLAPKEYKDEEAVAVVLTRLLLLEPGTYQHFPEMGVGLHSKYHNCLESDINNLKRDFEEQIEKYLPREFHGTQINVSTKGSILLISAEVDGSLYGITYDTTSERVDNMFTKISDL